MPALKSKTPFHELKSKAQFVLRQKNILGQRARVAAALDISGSMSGLYSDGSMQLTVERSLALGVQFDDNGAIDMYGFGQGAYEYGELAETDFNDWIKRMGFGRKLEGTTMYAGVMRLIIEKYYPGCFKTVTKKSGGFFGSSKEVLEVVPPSGPTGDPCYIMFYTDGNNYDPEEAELMVRESSKLGIFWQFIGLGNAAFTFLQKLDTLKGRNVDNANFFAVNDIAQIDDTELYNRMIGEFPMWLKEARSKHMIA